MYRHGIQQIQATGTTMNEEDPALIQLRALQAENVKLARDHYAIRP
jgi:hypothetical protein